MPLATLKELVKLSELKVKGVILERQYEVIKKHVKEGNSLTNGNWEAFDSAWGLRNSGVFSEVEWTTQIDGHILDITKNGARPLLSSHHGVAPSASGKRPAAAAAAASPASGAPNRGKTRKEDAAKNTHNIINAFAFGTGNR